MHHNERSTAAVALSCNARGAIFAASVEHDIFQRKVTLIGNAHEIAVVEAIAHNHLAAKVPGFGGTVNLKSARNPDDVGVELIHKLLRTAKGLDGFFLRAGICVVTGFAVYPYAIPRLQLICIRCLRKCSKNSRHYQK